MYGENYHKLSVQAGLNNFSFMYGVWHPYKFSCMHLYRKFFECFVYLERGSLPTGSQVVTHPKLAYVEKMIASLLLVVPVVIPILDKEIDRVQAYWAGVLTRGNIYATRRVNEDRNPEHERTWVKSIYATRRVNEAKMTRTRLDNLKQLRLLLGDYCAALFGVGCMVRECNWNGREYNTGLYGRTALQWVFCILMRLSPKDPHKIKYIKTVGVALMQWTSWHSVTPGVVYSEEFCEAFLSKVTHNLRVHSTRTSHEDYFDTFVLTKPCKNGFVNKRGGVEQKVVEVFERRIRTFVSGNFLLPRIRWTSEKTGVVGDSVSRCRESEQLPFTDSLNKRDIR